MTIPRPGNSPAPIPQRTETGPAQAPTSTPPAPPPAPPSAGSPDTAVPGDRFGSATGAPQQQGPATGPPRPSSTGNSQLFGSPLFSQTTGKTTTSTLSAASTHSVARDEVGRVDFKPGTQVMHESWKGTSLSGAMNGNTLDLNRVTPQMLKDLSPDNRKTFMGILGAKKFDVEVYNGAGKLKSGGLIFGRTSKVDGATAFAMKMWASGDSTAFAKTFAAAPEKVMPHLTGNGSRVLTAENMALIMNEMRTSQTASGKPGYDPAELNAMGSLVQKYLERNAGKDPAKNKAAVEQLMREVNRTMPFTPENAGVFTGTLISGMMKHFDQIKASDEQRNRILNGVFDGVAAGAGGFGPWGAVAAVGVVGLRTIYNEADRPRDFTEVANRMQGAVQLEWEQNPPKDWSPDDLAKANRWIQHAILNNGRR
jgi:hypothetical protein